MPAKRRGAPMLGIGRPENQREARRYKRINSRKQDLRARRRYDVVRRGCAIGSRRHSCEFAYPLRLRKPGQRCGGQIEKRIGVRIDPGGKVDPRLGRMRKQVSRPAKAAAMIHRRRNIPFRKSHVSNDRLPVARPRVANRLSGPRLPRHRPSGHLDRQADILSRPDAQPRDRQRPQPSPLRRAGADRDRRDSGGIAFGVGNPAASTTLRVSLYSSSSAERCFRN